MKSLPQIYIAFPTVEMPGGGGNQFLRLLKKEFQNRGVYTNAEEADFILFNSHQNVSKVIELKQKYHNKIFIHRIDGPIRLYNNMDDHRDCLAYTTNRFIAHATVFQSEWSRQNNYCLGLNRNAFETVILNASDTAYFYPIDKEANRKRIEEIQTAKRKIRIIATSWSSNIKKGFETYAYLDMHLDWNQYEMTFVGNSPIEFNNIKYVEPLTSKALGEALREADVYISASQKDPCSNSVIEALNTRIPVICLNDGGHPELVKDGGMLFENADEIPNILEKVVLDYEEIQKRINVCPAKDIADEYIRFAQEVQEQVELGKYIPKKIGAIKSLLLKARVRWWSR